MLTAKEQADILRIVRRMMSNQRKDLDKINKGWMKLTTWQWQKRRELDRKVLIDTLKEVG